MTEVLVEQQHVLNLVQGDLDFLWQQFAAVADAPAAVAYELEYVDPIHLQAAREIIAIAFGRLKVRPTAVAEISELTRTLLNSKEPTTIDKLNAGEKARGLVASDQLDFAAVLTRARHLYSGRPDTFPYSIKPDFNDTYQLAITIRNSFQKYQTKMRLADPQAKKQFIAEMQIVMASEYVQGLKAQGHNDFRIIAQFLHANGLADQLYLDLSGFMVRTSSQIKFKGPDQDVPAVGLSDFLINGFPKAPVVRRRGARAAPSFAAKKVALRKHRDSLERGRTRMIGKGNSSSSNAGGQTPRTGGADTSVSDPCTSTESVSSAVLPPPRAIKEKNYNTLDIILALCFSLTALAMLTGVLIGTQIIPNLVDLTIASQANAYVLGMILGGMLFLGLATLGIMRIHQNWSLQRETKGTAYKSLRSEGDDSAAASLETAVEYVGAGYGLSTISAAGAQRAIASKPSVGTDNSLQHRC